MKVAALSALMWVIHAGMALVVIMLVAPIIVTAALLVLLAAITEGIERMKKEKIQWQKR